VRVKGTTAKLKVALMGGASGVAAGLFLARVLLEAVRLACPGGLVLLAGLAFGLTGYSLGRWASRVIHPKWPAFLLLIYVLWPQRSLLVAICVAALAVISWILAAERPMPEWATHAADGVTFLAALVAYGATVAPDVLAADSGEFQLVAARLGVAHPPGYPLYTLVGNLFIRLWPWGIPAYRLNLFSALLAACTVVILAKAARIWATKMGASSRAAIAAGLTAALTLGTATTFWAQATTANIRMPTAFFTALVLLALARFSTAVNLQRADRALACLGLALGLGLGHHPSLVFPGFFFVLYVLLFPPRLVLHPNRWWPAVVAALVGFLPYVYLPIAAARGALLAPPGLTTLPGFMDHVLARGFGGDMFAYANVSDLPNRLTLLQTLFPFQFNAALLLAAGLGVLFLLWQDWRLFVLLGGSVLLHTFVAITYRAPQTVEYLMPAYLSIAVMVGLMPVLARRVLQLGFGRFANVAGVILAALALLAGLLNGWEHVPSFVELSRDRSTRDTVGPLLEEAPQGAAILADWRWATPLWYLQQVEEVRPDVQVEYVYNVAGEEYWDTWERRIRALPSDRPILLTHFYEFAGYTTEPWGRGFLIRPSPVKSTVAPLIPISVSFGDQVRVLGYSVQPSLGHAGSTVELDVAWEAVQAWEQPPSFTLRLTRDGGQRLAQADQALDADVSLGEIGFERLVLPLYSELLPGRYELQLGAYTVGRGEFQDLATADDENSVVLTELDLAPRTQRPYTLHPLVVPFAEGPTLVGVDYDLSIPDSIRVYLHWRGPAVGDRWSVRVEASTGSFAVAKMPAIESNSYQTMVVDPAGAEAGSLRLSLVDMQGKIIPACGPWSWRLERSVLPAVDTSARFVPVGGDLAVVGASARTAQPGGKAIIDVKLVSLRPLTDDLATSVRLMDTDGRWLDRHDMQPAQGAVPTLKWIRGSRVIDRHLLSIPEGFAGSSVQASMVVYERFREITLPVLDGRFRDVPLGSWSQPG